MEITLVIEGQQRALAKGRDNRNRLAISAAFDAGDIAIAIAIGDRDQLTGEIVAKTEQGRARSGVAGGQMTAGIVKEVEDGSILAGNKPIPRRIVAQRESDPVGLAAKSADSRESTIERLFAERVDRFPAREPGVHDRRSGEWSTLSFALSFAVSFTLSFTPAVPPRVSAPGAPSTCRATPAHAHSLARPAARPDRVPRAAVAPWLWRLLAARG
jgi:hypothetical protein